MDNFSDEISKFKKEFSRNIDKVIDESNNMDKETLELMKHMIKNLKVRVRE